MLARLQQARWRGEIVGPHGTGKSTLVWELVELLAARGCRVMLNSYSGGNQQWSHPPVADLDSPTNFPPRIIVIDGFEQLPALLRWLWKWGTWLRSQGLIVTAHQAMGLPTLHATTVPPSLAIDIARHIAGSDLGGLTPGDVEAALEANDGNMRDALFALYDQVEAERVTLPNRRPPPDPPQP